MIFEILNNFYLNFDKIKNVKKKYENFEMKFKQFFIKFYSNFIYLINQLKKYFERTKMNGLKRKIIFVFCRVICIFEFTFLKIFKRKFLFVDVKFDHINKNIFKKTNNRNIDDIKTIKQIV